MSYAAVDWAMAQALTPSARKFLLVTLAHHVNSLGRTCHPSIARLAEATSLDRKTVIAHLDGLEKAGYIADTGQRHGTTMQVKEYRLSMSNQAEQPSEEQSQKRDSSKNGTVPLLPSNSTVFPRKESQKRDTEQGFEQVSEQDIANRPPVSSKAADPCPHQAIIDLYHQTLPSGRQVRIWNDTRKAKLRARWKEDPKRQSAEWWGKFFSYIAESDFLTGKTASTNRPPFELDLEWIVTPANFVKIIEGKYHREAAA